MVWVWSVLSVVERLFFYIGIKGSIRLDLNEQLQHHQQVARLNRATYVVQIVVSAKTCFMLFKLARIKKILQNVITGKLRLFNLYIYTL